MTLPEIAGDPAAGDPQGVRELASSHTAIARGLRARATTVRSSLVPLEASIAQVAVRIRAEVHTHAEKFERAAATHEQLSVILMQYADDLDQLRADALRLRSRAQDEYEDLWMLRHRALDAATGPTAAPALAWDKVMPAEVYPRDTVHLWRWQSAIDDYRETVRRFTELFAQREITDRETARRIRAVDLAVEVFSASQRGSAHGRLAAVSLWAGDRSGVTARGIAGLRNPARVREAWNMLSEAQRAELRESSPMLVGNLDGVPLLDRIDANRQNISNEIDAREESIALLRARLDDVGAPGEEHPATVADESNVLLARIAAEQHVIDGFRSLLEEQITWYDHTGAMHTDLGARVVVFDPAHRAIATYHGAIDPVTRDVPTWLRNVAVFVPGTGTQMDDFSDDRGSDLARAAGGDTGMFVWAGGVFPQGGEAANAAYSRDLAPKLLSFVDGLDMPSNAAVTMIGYSYGSAIVGIAEAQGMQVDRVLYVAGAGIGLGNTSVAEFPGDADHYAIMARRDFIVGNSQGVYREDWGLGHGPSPLTDAGITRLETGWVAAGDTSSGGLDDYDSPDSRTAAGIDSHNNVFKLGSTSFDNIVGVIVGGAVEAFAPDEIRVVGGTTVSIDGINRDGYTPTRVTVR